MMSMDVLGLLLCFSIGLASFLHLVNAQQDDGAIAILEETSACLSQGTLSLSCPDDHVAIVRSAKYMKSRQRGCNPDSSNRCEQEDARTDLFWKCFLTQNRGGCDISMELSSAAGPCNGYRGDTFLQVTYRCEVFIADAHETHSRDMCNMEAVWQGALLYLRSPGYPELSQPPDCGCSVSIHPQVQLAITIFNFITADNKAQDCDQVFYIQSNGEERSICSENHVRDFTPLDMEYDSNVYFKFENTGGEFYAYQLILQVHHAQNVTVQCSRDYSMPVLQTTTPSILPSTPTASHTTHLGTQEAEAKPQRSPSKDKTSMHWPIITAAVGIVCVALTVVVAVLLFCRKKFHRKRSDSTRKLAFDNNVYMTNGQAASAKNQTVISMSKIDEIKTAARTNNSNQPKSSDSSNNEALGVQSETSLPYIANAKDIAIEDKESAMKKHPALAKLGGKPLNDLKAAYPDIPEALLKELGCQSEAVIAITKPNLATDGRSSIVKSNKLEKSLSPKKDDLQQSPFSRANPTHSSLTAKATNVKDKAEPKSSGSFSAGSVSTATDSEDTPYSSMGDLSIEDRAKLMAQQLKTARS